MSQKPLKSQKMETCINVPGFKVESPCHPLLAKLDHCHGSERVFRHPMFRLLVYTEGMQMLFEEGKCWWLLDLIGSVLGNHKVALSERKEVHVTRVDTKGAINIYNHDNRQPELIYSQKIPYTTFPFESFHFKMQQTVMELNGKETIHHILFLFSED
jgi:hypothetical protein